MLAAEDSGTLASPEQELTLDETEPRPAPVFTMHEEENPRPVSTVIDARPVALLNQKPVTWGDLRPIMTEAAGAAALDEFAVNKLVDTEARAQAALISADDIEAERQYMLDTLSEDPDTARRLLQAVRRSRGLGEFRFSALLQRNAQLRKLVRGSIQITDQHGRDMFTMMHGERRQPRLIMIEKLSDAERIIKRIDAGEAFSDLAVKLSTDSSAARGGLLEPIARTDPSYPAALREALWTLSTGEVSSPILIDRGYAILRLESIEPADDVVFEDVRSEMMQLARRQQEQLRMDQYVRQLQSQASLTVYDQILRRVWQQQ